MSLLSKLPQTRPVVDSLKSLWNDILEVLEKARPHDIPFALLYSVRDRECNMSPDDQLTPERLVLEGLVGIGDKNSDASLLLQLMPTERFKEPHLPEPRLLRMDQNTAFCNGMQLIAQDSKYPADNVLLCPILANDTVIGAFLLGVNSQAYDDDFRMFAQILSDSVGKYVSTFLLRKKLQDVQSALEALLRRVEEAERSNFMFRHMAESATVGCAILDPTGHPMWLNEAYISLNGVSREDFRPGIWQKAIVPEDLPKVEGCWNKLAPGEPIVPFTFRVKRHHNGTENAGTCESFDHRWLLSNAYVDLDEDGSCRRIMGWLND
jgi:PAS domain S-box-containing protein